MRDPRYDGDADLAALGRDVVVAHAAVRLGVLLEGQRGGAPLLEQLGQRVRRLPANHKQARVDLLETRVQVFEAL